MKSSICIASLLLVPSGNLLAQSARDGGPDSVETLLDEASRDRGSLLRQDLTQQWKDWRESLSERTGISFGLDYSTQAFWSTQEPAGADDEAAAGMVRFYGKWALVNRGKANAGSLNWKVEHRHRYTDTTPSGFGLNIGNVGVMGGPFNDDDTRLTNLYWRQEIGGRFVTYAGFLDVTDFVDVYALGSPWTAFTNLNFSTGASSMALPPDATFGAMGSFWLSDNVFSGNAFNGNVFSGGQSSSFRFHEGRVIGRCICKTRVVTSNCRRIILRTASTDSVRSNAIFKPRS